MADVCCVGLVMVCDVLISGLQSPNKGHQVRYFKLAATYKAMLSQDIRKYSRKFFSIGKLPQLEDIEVVFVDLFELILRLSIKLEHPND